VHLSGACFWICSVNFFILVHWCRRRGCGGCNRTPKILIWWKFVQNLRKFVHICKSSQNCCTCFDFTKFWKSCINLVIFGQLKGNLGKFWWNLVFKLPQFEKKCAQWNAVVFSWRSFSLDSFSGKFAEIWAKILCTPKNLPAPTPMFSYMRFIDETYIDIKLSVSKGSVNVLSTYKMKTIFLLALDFAETTRCRGTISRLQ